MTELSSELAVSIVKELRGIKRWMGKTDRHLLEVDRKLEDNNHLRRDLPTKEDLQNALKGMVVVHDLGEGEFSVLLGDVVLGDEELNELPFALRASRSAREAANSAKDAAASAAQHSTLRSLWFTAIATAGGSLAAAISAIAGVLLFLHLKGLL